MRLSRRSIPFLGVLCLTVGSLSAWGVEDPPKTVPDKTTPPVVAIKPKSKGATVTAAVATLQKEFQAYAKSPKGNKIREKSDYFKLNPSPDATPETILKALESSVSGGYLVESYVKWQLLSGITDKLPEDLIKRFIAVYRRAPSPADHPGFDRRAMNKAIMGLKKEAIPEVQKEFDAAVADIRAVNHVVLSYRDELYARLPVRLDVLSAGLEDAASRAAKGLNANSIFDNVAVGIRSWALTQAKTGQVGGMIDELLQLKNSISRDANKPFNKLVDDGGVKWKAEGSAIDHKKLDELIKFLENNVTASGGGGLKFKDDKK